MRWRAVQPNFPFYGRLELDGAAYSHDLLRGNGVIVRPELLAQLRMAKGDSLLIGGKPFVFAGADR